MVVFPHLCFITSLQNMSFFSVEAKFFSKWTPATIYATFVLLYSLVTLSNYVACEQCLATAFAGTFRGVFSQSQSVVTPDFPYCRFCGMRYAQPPKGNLRFARPVLAAPLEGGVYNAYAEGNKCVQFNPGTNSSEGDEDCLFLNVYTPQVTLKTQDKGSQSLLPVMVYIYGSAFVFGSSDSQIYGPDYIVSQNVVLVSMNYRLSVFGFLNLKEQQCSGNMALADQILACRWVQQNIQAFGGDPNNVTLFGESTGGHSAYLLSLSPQARGLFHRVIIQSTVYSTESYLVRDPDQVVNSSIQLARIVGYEGNQSDHSAILRYLLEIPAEILVAKHDALCKLLLKNDFNGFYHSYGAPFFPCMDYYVEDGILPSSFEEMGKTVPPIPFMIGQLDADAAILLREWDMVKYTENNLQLFLREANPMFVKDQQTWEKIEAEVKACYYNSSNNDNEVDETVKLLTFLSYYNFYKQISYLRASYRSGNIRVYQFRFSNGSYDMALKQIFIPQYPNLVRGAIHAEELPYLFYISKVSFLMPSNDDRKLINEMSTWWTNFAKTGNPNSVTDGIEVEWEPSTPTQNKYLEINTETRLVNKKINQEDCDFFAELEKSVKNQEGQNRNCTSLPTNAPP